MVWGVGGGGGGGVGRDRDGLRPNTKGAGGVCQKGPVGAVKRVVGCGRKKTKKT